jgi:hypothetical protein
MHVDIGDVSFILMFLRADTDSGTPVGGLTLRVFCMPRSMRTGMVLMPRKITAYVSQPSQGQLRHRTILSFCDSDGSYAPVSCAAEHSVVLTVHACVGYRTLETCTRHSRGGISCRMR